MPDLLTLNPKPYNRLTRCPGLPSRRGPSMAGECGDVVLDATASTGNAGRQVLSFGHFGAKAAKGLGFGV